MIEFHVPEERIENMVYQIEAYGDRANELEPVLQRVTDKILDRNKRNFETRGGSSGIFWAPLKATTILRKGGGTFHRKRGGYRGIPYPDRPLWRYGNLMKSLSERGAPDQEIRVDDDGLYIATHHESARFHTTGTKFMPPRPPLIIPAKHAHEYVGMINDFIFGEA
jgi:hypothetical protein